MKKRISLNLNNISEAAQIGKALSSEIRLEFLKLLVDRSANISEIAKEFQIPLSTAALHAKVLEDAGLISTKTQPGIRGAQKVCGLAFEDIYFNVFTHQKHTESKQVFTYPMPIGCYSDCQITEPCGIVNEQFYLGDEDSIYGFYSNERLTAQLLWFTTGYVEYRFPAQAFKNGCATEVKFSFEICSEAPGYNNDWPSDITVWVNEKEICTIYSGGDYGGRRGELNPDWWRDSMTQYGELKKISINEFGCFENSVKCSDYTIQELGFQDNYYVSLKIGVKPDAVNRGGMNLFGEKFGDYPQGLIMKVTVRRDEELKGGLEEEERGSLLEETEESSEINYNYPE